LEDVFQDLEWGKRGIKRNGEYLSNLRCADDVVLVSQCDKEMQKMTDEFMLECNEVGPSINATNTVLLFNAKYVQDIRDR
jgi:predicted GTPase